MENIEKKPQTIKYRKCPSSITSLFLYNLLHLTTTIIQQISHFSLAPEHGTEWKK